jgi:hypothetical protein
MQHMSHGDAIVAMLLHGFSAQFGKPTESMNRCCLFKAKVHNPFINPILPLIGEASKGDWDQSLKFYCAITY